MDYKEKLRLAKEALESGSYDRETIEYIFPELKESEDEEIRKNLITFFKDEYGKNSNARFTGIKVKDIIAWLEKQVEQKPINDTDEEIVEAVKDTSVLDMVEQKSTWSEADERNLKSIMKIIKEKAFADYDVDEDNNMLGIYGILESWLKSLKERLKGE